MSWATTSAGTRTNSPREASTDIVQIPNTKVPRPKVPLPRACGGFLGVWNFVIRVLSGLWPGSLRAFQVRCAVHTLRPIKPFRTVMKKLLALSILALFGAAVARAEVSRADLVTRVETCEAILQEFQSRRDTAIPAAVLQK